jgi:hypothetical protein
MDATVVTQPRAPVGDPAMAATMITPAAAPVGAPAVAPREPAPTNQPVAEAPNALAKTDVLPQPPERPTGGGTTHVDFEL